MTRIITWNCNLALQGKLSELLMLRPDVAIVQECEKDLVAPAGWHFRWLGDGPRKGLGVLAREQLVLGPSTPNGWTYFLPITLPVVNLRLLAVWAFNHRAGTGRMGSPTTAIFHLRDWLSEGRSIVAGDFNNSLKWDRKGNQYNFQSVADSLDLCGLRSAYHSYMSAQYGAEIDPSYFHTKNVAKPHHIDFCFVHESIAIRRVEMGRFLSWRKYSDHVPLITDLNDAYLPAPSARYPAATTR